MFAVGWPELVLAALLVASLILAFRVGGATAWVRVDDRSEIPVAAADLEWPLTRLLDNLTGSRVHAAGPATWTVSVHRAQWWTILPAVLLFPLGLLFLLFREQADLQVALRERPGGSEVRVTGRTRRSVAETIGRAVDGLPHPSPSGTSA